MTPRDFRRLYNNQDGVCAITGLKLSPTRQVAPRGWDNKRSDVLGIGIKPTNKNSTKYQLVAYPYAYTWYKQRSAIINNIDPAIADEFPISYAVFFHFLKEVENSINKYPINIIISSEDFRLRHQPKTPSKTIKIRAITTFSDGVSSYSTDCFSMMITDDIEVVVYQPNDSKRMNTTSTYKISLADPSIDFIDHCIKFLNIGIVNAFKSLTMRFYPEF